MIEYVIENGVARLTLARPPVNAISEDWLARFNQVLDELGGRSDWTVLHIVSSQKVFCAGADLAEVRARFESATGDQDMHAYVGRIQDLFARIEALPGISLAEISGAAMGGGLELALSCDLRIAADEAQLGLPEVRLGLLPGAGGTQRLTRLCGRATASRIILGAEVVDGRTAADLGIVHWTAPRAELSDRGRSLAERVAGLSGAALAGAKACIAAADDPQTDGYRLERDTTRTLFALEDTRQRVGGFLDRTLK